MTQRDQGGYIIDVENPVGASRATLHLFTVLYHGCADKEAEFKNVFADAYSIF